MNANKFPNKVEDFRTLSVQNVLAHSFLLKNDLSFKIKSF